MNPYHVGLSLDDLNPVKHVKNAVEAVADAVSSVVDRIPGSGWLKDAVNTVTGPVGDFIKGPLRDFANTGLGETVLRSISVAVSMSTYGLAPSVAGIVFPAVGAAISFAAWSIPGIARGEPFDEALVREFIYRVSECARIFSGKFGDAVAQNLGKVFGEQLTTALQAAKAKWDAGMGLSASALAAELGIREDVAAYAIAWVKREGTEASLRLLGQGYDPVTGKKLLTKQGVTYAAVSDQTGFANAVRTPVNKTRTIASDQFMFSSLNLGPPKPKATMVSDQMQFSQLPMYQAALAAAKAAPVAGPGVYATNPTPGEGIPSAKGTEGATTKILLIAAGAVVLGAAGWFLLKRGRR